jgi:hypothetical protein
MVGTLVVSPPLTRFRLATPLTVAKVRSLLHFLSSNGSSSDLNYFEIAVAAHTWL